MASTSELVALGDRVVPLEALRLGWALEDRGLVLSVKDGSDGAYVLTVSLPGGGKPTLAEAEIEAIRRWKDHLIGFLVEPAQSERNQRNRKTSPRHR